MDDLDDAFGEITLAAFCSCSRAAGPTVVAEVVRDRVAAVAVVVAAEQPMRAAVAILISVQVLGTHRAKSPTMTC